MAYGPTALADLRKEKKIKCLGRGPDAQWERYGADAIITSRNSDMIRIRNPVSEHAMELRGREVCRKSAYGGKAQRLPPLGLTLLAFRCLQIGNLTCPTLRIKPHIDIAIKGRIRPVDHPSVDVEQIRAANRAYRHKQKRNMPDHQVTAAFQQIDCEKMGAAG